MDSFREILFDYRTTARAHLGCIGRIDQNYFATGTRSLVRNVSPESIPACIQYSLSHVWILFDAIFDIVEARKDFASHLRPGRVLRGTENRLRSTFAKIFERCAYRQSILAISFSGQHLLPGQ